MKGYAADSENVPDGVQIAPYLVVQPFTLQSECR